MLTLVGNSAECASSSINPLKLLLLSEYPQPDLVNNIYSWQREQTKITEAELIIDSLYGERLASETLTQLEDDYDWIVTVDESAFKLISNRPIPPANTVSLRLNKDNYELIKKRFNAYGYSIYIFSDEVPLNILSTVGARLFPQRKTHGIIISDNRKRDKVVFDDLTKAIGAKSFSLFLRSSDHPQKAFERLAQNCDLIIAANYPKLYLEAELKNYLLSAFRYNIPVIGTSMKSTQLGAPAAVYVSDRNLVEQFMPKILDLKHISSEKKHVFLPNQYNIAFNFNTLAKFGISDLKAKEILSTLTQTLPIEETE